ncbi:MAG: hypothetical protein AVDCRST_MAG10-2462, partial [uncultured Acidimicrobiales bacterium]
VHLPLPGRHRPPYLRGHRGRRVRLRDGDPPVRRRRGVRRLPAGGTGAPGPLRSHRSGPPHRGLRRRL